MCVYGYVHIYMIQLNAKIEIFYIVSHEQSGIPIHFGFVENRLQ